MSKVEIETYEKHLAEAERLLRNQIDINKTMLLEKGYVVDDNNFYVYYLNGECDKWRNAISLAKYTIFMDSDRVTGKKHERNAF